MTKNRLLTAASLLLLLVALVAVNVLAGLVPLRLDVTQQRLYTLADGSRRILAALPDPVTVKLYVPDSVADAPVGVKTFSRKVRELLREYQSASKGKLTVQVYDPKPDSEDEDWATRYGMTPARMPDGTQLFFGMVALSGGREAAVPFFDPRRERFLEYDISQTIARVNQQAKPKVAVLSWLPVMGQPTRMGAAEGEWYFLQELRKSYSVEYLFPQQQDLLEIPDGTHLLIVIYPKRVPDTLSYAIDQYLLRGGKAIVFVDPNSRMDPMSAQAMAAEPSSLEKLFQAWGVQTEGDKVVGDRQLATRVSAPNQGVVDFPLWISLTRRNLNADLAITSELEEVTLIDAGDFRTGKDFKYTFTPVLTSSKQSGLLDLSTVRFASPLDIAKQLKTDDTARVLAGLLTGKLDSAFPEGPPRPPPPEKKAGEKKDSKPEPARKHAFLPKAAQETSVLLVGDADFLADRFSVQLVNFFGNPVAQPLNDNLNFVLNAVEFMTGSQDLIHIRSRGQLSRPFTRLQDLQVKAAVRFQQQEQLLSKRLEEVKRKLTELESQKQPGQKLVLSPAQLEEVNKFRREEARVRTQLREVRRVLRQDIDNLGNWLLAANLLLMPMVVAAAGFAVILRRSRRR